jgi:hypothetical protein
VRSRVTAIGYVRHHREIDMKIKTKIQGGLPRTPIERLPIDEPPPPRGCG